MASGSKARGSFEGIFPVFAHESDREATGVELSDSTLQIRALSIATEKEPVHARLNSLDEAPNAVRGVHCKCLAEICPESVRLRGYANESRSVPHRISARAVLEIACSGADFF